MNRDHNDLTDALADLIWAIIGPVLYALLGLNTRAEPDGKEAADDG